MTLPTQPPTPPHPTFGEPHKEVSLVRDLWYWKDTVFPFYRTRSFQLTHFNSRIACTGLRWRQ